SSDDFDRAMKQDRHALVLKPDDDGGWQRRRRDRGPQSVRISKVEDELHTTIGRDVLLALGRIRCLLDPEALYNIREDLVRVVLVVFHVPTLGDGPDSWPAAARAPSSRRSRTLSPNVKLTCRGRCKNSLLRDTVSGPGRLQRLVSRLPALSRKNGSMR